MVKLDFFTQSDKDGISWNTETIEFLFRGKTLCVHVPVSGDGVLTSKFCPKELLNGGLSCIKPMNGEAKDEFISDCQKQIIAMNQADEGSSLLDVHIAGLMAVVMDHISRCGRIIFGDLLIYMDCFCLLLEADGFPESEIRQMYPRVVRAIVDLYPELVFNSGDLTPFKNGLFDFILSKLISDISKHNQNE